MEPEAENPLTPEEIKRIEELCIKFIEFNAEHRLTLHGFWMAFSEEQRQKMMEEYKAQYPDIQE